MIEYYDNVNDVAVEIPMKYTVVISGSREFTDYKVFHDFIIEHINNIDSMVFGDCIGIDKLALRFAVQYKIPYKVFVAQWSKYGNSAGPIRNTEMLKYAIEKGNPILIAFPKNNSKGTRNAIRTAEYYKIPVITKEV